MSDKSYTNEPVSVSEARAERDQKNGGAIWTPRDVLVSLLRSIDSGAADPTALVVIYEQRSEAGGERISYLRSGDSHHRTLGMLCEAMARMTENRP